jgi:hypothetical protein
MIVSYQHRFIFWKPPKTAGTSVQCGLGEFCGEDDIVTPINPTPQAEGYDIVYIPRNHKKFDSHMMPMQIRNKVGQDIWNEFFKITVVRNPWDLCVSRMWWRLALPQIKKGKKAANIIAPQKISKSACGGKIDRYYFHPKTGKPLADFFIRYEHINEDYKEVCKKIGIPHKKLPKLKGGIRNNREYATYYDNETKNAVARNYKNIISHFGYRF